MSETSPSLQALTGALVRLALAEDVGAGDVTTQAVVDRGRLARGEVRAKQAGVLYGLEPAREVARAVDPEVRFEARLADGAALASGTIVLTLEGRARSLLTMERVLLNFLQQLSGVATETRRYVEAVSGTGVAIADTRKTTPGLRFFEKAAVQHGGGVNHRIGLWDAFMVKDNHVVAAGSLSAAVERIRAQGVAVDQILLDNLDPAEIELAVAVIRGIEAREGRPRARIEVSGGVTLDTVRSKALPGVDLISVGALTHSAPAVDLSLDLAL
jgi:nicotinate-nucleotide pyrophosphorylase (carboxylating)